MDTTKISLPRTLDLFLEGKAWLTCEKRQDLVNCLREARKQKGHPQKMNEAASKALDILDSHKWSGPEGLVWALSGTGEVILSADDYEIIDVEFDGYNPKKSLDHLEPRHRNPYAYQEDCVHYGLADMLIYFENMQATEPLKLKKLREDILTVFNNEYLNLFSSDLGSIKFEPHASPQEAQQAMADPIASHIFNAWLTGKAHWTFYEVFIVYDEDLDQEHVEKLEAAWAKATGASPKQKAPQKIRARR